MNPLAMNLLNGLIQSFSLKNKVNLPPDIQSEVYDEFSKITAGWEHKSSTLRWNPGTLIHQDPFRFELLITGLTQFLQGIGYKVMRRGDGVNFWLEIWA